MANTSSLGVIGLGVMGENIALNFADHGETVTVFNRTKEKALRLAEAHSRIQAAETLGQFFQMLTPPRTILLMVPAGNAVDEMIDQMKPHLLPGDCVLDGGNSFYKDSQRRAAEAEKEGYGYIDLGISGGESGARHGPSMMAGGKASTWNTIAPRFKTIAARTEKGAPCCAYIGPSGAGHFVKMVHNGIEYGQMELISEIFGLMRECVCADYTLIAACFRAWNRTPLQSYLLEISAHILEEADDQNPADRLLDAVLDRAGQKGTGNWSMQCALRYNVNFSISGAALDMRNVSEKRVLREKLAEIYGEKHPLPPQFSVESETFLRLCEKALHAAQWMLYDQGFSLIKAVSDAENWSTSYSDLARIWQNGCILRSFMLKTIEQIFMEEPTLVHLIFAENAQKLLNENAVQIAWRNITMQGIQQGVPMPAFAAAISGFDMLRSTHLSTDLIQLQRDCFGAHTFERKDAPRGTFFHHTWNLGGES